MKKPSAILNVLVAASIVVVAPFASAEKPSWAGGDKHEKGKDKHKGERGDDRDDRNYYETRRSDSVSVDVSIGGINVRFGDRDREMIRSYYTTQARSGHCPPGLAKKNNGCMPPGQAKKWAKGKPLPRDVEYHDLPRELSVRLPMPPSGHRYVQVAADILLIAVGTGMVVDAVEDLMR
jgi:Ni/Co efflux regulator RcnB